MARLRRVGGAATASEDSSLRIRAAWLYYNQGLTQRESEVLYKQLQEQVMNVRMVPVGPLFQQLVRAVRDISHSHNKLARLEIIGAEVEVDTRVLEQLKDPLRPAIGHVVNQHPVGSAGVSRPQHE